MHPVISHVASLARDVQNKLEGTKITPASVQSTIDEMCTHEWPQIRARVADEVWRSLGSEERHENSATDSVTTKK